MAEMKAAEVNKLFEEMYRPLSEVLHLAVAGIVNVRTYHPDCFQEFFTGA